MDAPLRPRRIPPGIALTFVAAVAFSIVTYVALSELLFWSHDNPLVPLFASILFITAVIASLGALVRASSALHRFAPATICVTVALIVAFVPFSSIARQANFERYRGAREAAIRSLTLSADTDDLIPVDGNGQILSEGGGVGGAPPNRVAVARCGQAKCILFFTYQREKFQSAQGFLYVPPGGDPSRFDWYGHYATQPIRDRWYFAKEV